VQKVQRNCKAVCVLYEEPLDTDSIDRAVDYIEKADMLIVGGTSLRFIRGGAYTILPGDRLVLINKSPTLYDRRANLIIRTA